MPEKEDVYYKVKRERRKEIILDFTTFFIIVIILLVIVVSLMANTNIFKHISELGTDINQAIISGISKQTCIDSDGGKNYTVKGTATAGRNSKTDYCSSTSVLVEYFCSRNSAKYVNYVCPAGSMCSYGACIIGCVPKTCSSLGKQCGTWSDNCGGTLNCGICGTGNICNSAGICEQNLTVICQDDLGCTSVGSFCDGNITYNCSAGIDGCLDRISGSVCGIGYTCTNGQCLGCIPNCTGGKVCGSNGCGGSCGTCPIGKSCNSTGRCEERVIRLASSITQYNITWYFDKEYEYGQFVNGDYWVIGPIKVINITKPGNMPGRDGSMVNPKPHYYNQGYDSRNSHYNASLDASLLLPNLIVGTNSSLVSVISHNPTNPAFPTFEKSYLQLAAVLTILDKAPPIGSFRPPFVGNEKKIYSSDNLRTDLLLQLAPVDNTPSLSSFESMLEKPWVDHVCGWEGTRIRPYKNMLPYGAQIARDTGDAALLLMLNFSIEEKRTLLIRFIQMGIDDYWTHKLGCSWGTPGGTIGVGKKMPILFAGLILDDDYMKNISYDYDKKTFQEDDQTFYLTQIEKTGTYDPINCASDLAYCHPGFYDNLTLGTPAWIESHSGWLKDTTKRGCPGKAAYLQSTFRSTRGTALIMHILNAEKLWDYNAFFDWSDLKTQTGQTGVYGSPFSDSMWAKYRKNYNCIWELDDPNSIILSGHYNCTGKVFSCTFQNSVIPKATSCSQYPNQKACDYDPCNLGCDGICGTFATEKPVEKRTGFWNWIKDLFS